MAEMFLNINEECVSKSNVIDKWTVKLGLFFCGKRLISLLCKHLVNLYYLTFKLIGELHYRGKVEWIITLGVRSEQMIIIIWNGRTNEIRIDRNVADISIKNRLKIILPLKYSGKATSAYHEGVCISIRIISGYQS